MESQAEHPFVNNPHRTLLIMSIPVTLSVIAEPVTGLVDTAFIARLGTAELAALGIGTTALSSIFWVFNFLGIGTQTEVAQALGRGDKYRATEIFSLAIKLGMIFGIALIAIFLPLASLVSSFLGASGDVQHHANLYLQIRLFGAPAILTTFIAFGALRGLQDMHTPLYVAVGINGANILLDALLIFGLGPVPAMGIAGAALASVISQWFGTAWVLFVTIRRLGFVLHIEWGDVASLLSVGSNLFFRTGSLMFFLLLGTRIANQISPEAGAAHQAIRTLWIFMAFFMDGFAVTAQSLVGYFLGARSIFLARHAAMVATWWGLGTGFTVAFVMLIGTDLVIHFFVPGAAVEVFRLAWIVALGTQPLASLAFVTDGIHWGTGDYAFLRNIMLLATLLGIGGLFIIDTQSPEAFTLLWMVTAIWLAIRSLFGVLRIWPGIGLSPLRPTPASS